MPYISIVTRRMYGVASVMAKTDGMSVRYAWPSAESGSLVAQGGVMAAYRREIEAAPDPVAKRLEIEDRFQRMASVLRQPGLARPLEIIDPRDTRPAIVDYHPQEPRGERDQAGAEAARRHAALEGEGSDVEVKSEIYAIVWKIQVAEGADVAADDVLMILESMKMEVPVNAPYAGRVRSIAVAEGDSVDEDDVLVVLDPA